jgi:hypothetical protein
MVAVAPSARAIAKSAPSKSHTTVAADAPLGQQHAVAMAAKTMAAKKRFLQDMGITEVHKESTTTDPTCLFSESV